MNKAQRWKWHQRLVKELMATKSVQELQTGVKALDARLKETEKKKEREKVANELTAWGMAYACKIVEQQKQQKQQSPMS